MWCQAKKAVVSCNSHEEKKTKFSPAFFWWFSKSLILVHHAEIYPLLYIQLMKKKKKLVFLSSIDSIVWLHNVFALWACKVVKGIWQMFSNALLFSCPFPICFLDHFLVSVLFWHLLNVSYSSYLKHWPRASGLTNL